MTGAVFSREAIRRALLNARDEPRAFRRDRITLTVARIRQLEESGMLDDIRNMDVTLYGPDARDELRRLRPGWFV